MFPMKDTNDLVLRAMRLAEKAHRTREAGSHFRKGPGSVDKPSYFLHLTEVAWMLQDAGYTAPVVAAGYLHDVIEDCDYTREMLAVEIGNEHVVNLVCAVTEPGKNQTWEVRNATYLKNIRDAAEDVLALSCADKASNLNDMNRLNAEGHAVGAFTSRGHSSQLGKFVSLDRVYRGKVAEPIYSRFRAALNTFESSGY
ncbi:MAG: HD domain-containing protein [Gammaproteobacteria bacterium]|nr:HD domain-containing protein [Gammaproteobacteria bacterium]